MASADNSAVASARETYIGHVDKMLQLCDELDSKLAQVETSSRSADTKLSEVHNTLEDHLKNTKIASTVGSATSIIGVILLFTPAAPLGVVLTVGGAATSVGTGVAQSYFFEADASKEFANTVNYYTSSSDALQKLFHDIEDTKEKMFQSLTEFLARLHAHGLPDPGAGNPPGAPSSGPKGPDDPKAPHTPNQFSSVLLQGLANTTAAVGKSGGKVLVKGLPILGRAVPVVSIVIDIASIVTTWTNSNDTLEQAGKLKNDILQSAAAFRNVVQEYQSALKDLFGDQTLQSSLRKLLRLPRPPPGPPGGPPDEPEKACKMFKMMEQMPDIPLMVFAALQGDAHEDPTENKYVTELVPQAHVQQLSQMSASAPVVDAVYERHPDIEQPTDEQKERPKEGVYFGSIAFRLLCSWNDISGENVYNVNGSSIDKRVSSWVGYWEYWGYWSWWFSAREKVNCLDRDCHVEGQQHSNNIVGGHMEMVDTSDKSWYILPICQQHNAPAGTYDRPQHGQVGQYLTTTSTPRSWAVRIPSLF